MGSEGLAICQTLSFNLDSLPLETLGGGFPKLRSTPYHHIEALVPQFS
jgi:hypothetical protein